jgi:hypothetical protein
MMRWLFAVLASAGLIACGLVHGYWTDRWVPATAPQEAADRLESLPLEIGDWRGERIEVKPTQGGEGIAGCIQRRYVHRQSGVIMVLALVCGRPGPVSIHTPEVCYGASGYDVGPRSRYSCEPGDRPAAFWTADATRIKTTEETRLRLYWGWNSSQGWTATDEPRMEFARFPVLHKLYVLRELSSKDEHPPEEPCEAFLRVLLPVLDRSLFPAGS